MIFSYSSFCDLAQQKLCRKHHRKKQWTSCTFLNQLLGPPPHICCFFGLCVLFCFVVILLIILKIKLYHWDNDISNRCIEINVCEIRIVNLKHENVNAACPASTTWNRTRSRQAGNTGAAPTFG